METARGVAPSRLRALPSWLLNQTALKAQRLVTRALVAADASRYHYSVLSALEEFGPASQAALGRRCGIDRSDMVPLASELEAKKLIRRAPDPTDGRRNVITITRAGIRRLQKLDELLAGAQDELLAPLSVRERSQLVRMLTRILDYPDEDREGDPARSPRRMKTA
jgi:MarR family transcriptional regulator, lower aerobic nicotinate degradation pathway regulator